MLPYANPEHVRLGLMNFDTLVAERKLEFGYGWSRRPLRHNHPGEPATRTMTTHPDHGQDVPMATMVDHPADSDSPLASRAPELTRRFVNDGLPYLNQLNERARQMTPNAVDTEDLVQETMLRAYAGFNTVSDGTDLRTSLLRIMTYVNGLHRGHQRL
jgi:Sigma-70 region 2